MASPEREMSREIRPSLEELSRRGARALLLPFVIGFASSVPPSQDHLTLNVFVDRRTSSITFVEISDRETVPRKDGPRPASKASIEAMPVVKVVEEGRECAICLTDFEIGAFAKEMPCKHGYHSGCIEKWLGIHGSCPVCRFQMPEEEEERSTEREDAAEQDHESRDDEGLGEGSGVSPRRGEVVFQVIFSRRSRLTPESNRGSGGEIEFTVVTSSVSTSSSEESSAQAMEIED